MKLNIFIEIFLLLKSTLEWCFTQKNLSAALFDWLWNTDKTITLSAIEIIIMVNYKGKHNNNVGYTLRLSYHTKQFKDNVPSTSPWLRVYTLLPSSGCQK